MRVVQGPWGIWAQCEKALSAAAKIAVVMEIYPAQCGQNALRLAGNIGDAFRRAMNMLCRDRSRHEAEKGLGDAQMNQINLGGEQRGIHFDGPLKLLQTVLHPMAVERLPLMASAQENLVGLAASRSRLLFGRSGGSRDGESASPSNLVAVAPLPEDS